MSEPAGPLLITVHDDDVDLQLELRSTGGLGKLLAPLLGKLHEFALSQSSSPDVAMPEHVHVHTNSGAPSPYPHMHTPTDLITEMVSRQCNTCLDALASAVTAERARRDAEMS